MRVVSLGHSAYIVCPSFVSIGSDVVRCSQHCLRWGHKSRLWHGELQCCYCLLVHPTTYKNMYITQKSVLKILSCSQAIQKQPGDYCMLPFTSTLLNASHLLVWGMFPLQKLNRLWMTFTDINKHKNWPWRHENISRCHSALRYGIDRECSKIIKFTCIHTIPY